MFLQQHAIVCFVFLEGGHWREFVHHGVALLLIDFVSFLSDFRVGGCPVRPQRRPPAPSPVFTSFLGGVLEAIGHDLSAKGVKRAIRIVQRRRLGGSLENVWEE